MVDLSKEGQSEEREEGRASMKGVEMVKVKREVRAHLETWRVRCVSLDMASL